MFKDNGIITSFKILNLINMPFRQMRLASLGCAELETLSHEHKL